RTAATDAAARDPVAPLAAWQAAPAGSALDASRRERDCAAGPDATRGLQSGRLWPGVDRLGARRRLSVARPPSGAPNRRAAAPGPGNLRRGGLLRSAGRSQAR